MRGGALSGVCADSGRSDVTEARRGGPGCTDAATRKRANASNAPAEVHGHPEVVEAANRHGRMGIGMGAGVGLLFGMFAPPLGLALVVGAAAGGLVASFAEHELRSGLRHEVGASLEAGTAVIIAIVYPNGRAPMESTISNAASVTELRMDRSTINSLEAAVEEAMSQLHRRTVIAGTTDTST